MPLQTSYATYDGSALNGAVWWIAQAVTGSLGVTIAVIAISWTGLGMLQGWIDLRRAGRIVLGCFILFGAPMIARGIIATATDERTRAAKPAPPAIVATPAAPPQFDPYAGAALPK